MIRYTLRLEYWDGTVIAEREHDGEIFYMAVATPAQFLPDQYPPCMIKAVLKRREIFPDETM